MPGSPSPPTTYSPSSPTLFCRLESYPWLSDSSFQSGLLAILGPEPSRSPASQLADLTLRARCFYYTRRFNQPVDYDAYVAWRRMQRIEELAPLELEESIASRNVTGSGGGRRSSVGMVHLDLSSPPESAPQTPEPPAVAQMDGPPDVNGNKTVIKTNGDSSNGTKADELIDGGEESLGDAQPHYPQSFSEVMELIQAGKPLPGIREIPKTVLEGQGTSSRMSQRRKPWESRLQQ